MGAHVALDIGGTFTDLVYFDDRTGELRHSKSSTTPEDFTLGIENCLNKAKVAISDCEIFVHGATIAINTLIEQTGARTVLVTTQGARDAYLIGRGNRPEAYNVLFKRTTPLVRRGMILEANERMTAQGEAILPLTDAETAAVCEKVAGYEPEAIAVCFLHSYVDPSHEQIMGRALRKAFPNAYISLSHEILRQYREYERSSTTVVNSYIGPRVSTYLKRLEGRLEERKFPGTVLIMQSNGGVTSVASASRAPVGLMESGPVGGINASAEIGRRLGFPQVIAFDMGGTTAKASVIRDGQPATAEGYYVGGYASGHPVMLPVVDVVEVGAGGGSIGWIDSVGAMKVGPKSAGASPGPVCYRAGGTEPTITDCNLALGRLNGANFLGGDMSLDRDASRAALKEKLADKLGLTIEEAALGMLKITIAHMTLAVRGVSIERGYDPRDFVMVASGGNGGLHAPLIARELSIPKVILPVLPGHFSAVGMLMTDIRHDYVQTHARSLADVDFAAVQHICDGFVDEGKKLLASEGVAPEQQQIQLSLDIRYVGQEFYLATPVTYQEMVDADRDGIRRHFDALHLRHYGQNAERRPVEIVNIRASAVGERAKMEFKPGAGGHGTSSDAKPTQRDVYLTDAAKPTRCMVYQRDALKPGDVLTGPAIIEEVATTGLLLDSDEATVMPTGEIIITIGGV
jgi:N-methylhydantoinase A